MSHLVSRKEEIIDGMVVETLVQLVCQNPKCRKLSTHCRCDAPSFQPVESTYRRPVKTDAEERAAHPEMAMDAEESKKLFESKTAAHLTKQNRQNEVIRVAGMDEEDFLKEEDERKQKSQDANWEAEKARETAQNTDEIIALKKSLQTTGKTKVEVQSAISALKDAQKKRGRPAKDAILNPQKNPLTGEFESSAE